MDGTGVFTIGVSDSYRLVSPHGKEDGPTMILN